MKSLNKVQLIGNITKDPELKYTGTGTAVCTFTIATNRSWTTDTGDKKDEADFTRVVAWQKLAEICGKLLKKGRKVYVEGRLSNRSYQDKDGQTKYISEVVISDMILLDSKGVGSENASGEEIFEVPDNLDEINQEIESKPAKSKKKAEEETAGEDIPF